MEWIIEIGLAFLRIFMQPFIYLYFLFILLSGYIRVGKDRKSFGVKVNPYFFETKHTLSVSLVMGIILSIVSIGAGFIVSIPFSLLLGLVMLLVAIWNTFHWLSAGYVLAISAAVMYFIDRFGNGYLPSKWMEVLDTTDLFYIPFLIVLLMIAEYWYLARVSPYDTIPELRKSGRGKFVGQHRIKKLTIIPFFAFIPGGMLEPFAEWWPLFEVAGESFGLILIPYLFGLEYVAKTMLPQQAATWLKSRTLLLGIFILLLALGAYFQPFISIIALAAAFLGKEIIYFSYRQKERRDPPVFQPAENGLAVLGVLPNTPAVDLGLEPGEIIRKVNNISVSNEDEFYRAVNKNRAFCKLNIEALNGEIRFAQRALYEGEHHKLGVLFVNE